MKNNPILKRKDIKTGTHLRCTINCEGLFSTERIHVQCVPYRKNTTVGREWMVQKKSRYDNGYFVSYLLGYEYSRLLKFSHKMEAKLEKAVDVFDFIFILNGKSFSETEKHEMLDSWMNLKKF